MLLAVFPLLLTIGGAFFYAVPENPKLSELGRIAFACGLLALALALSQHVVRIG